MAGRGNVHPKSADYLQLVGCGNDLGLDPRRRREQIDVNSVRIDQSGTGDATDARLFQECSELIALQQDRADDCLSLHIGINRNHEIGISREARLSSCRNRETTDQHADMTTSGGDGDCPAD